MPPLKLRMRMTFIMIVSSTEHTIAYFVQRLCKSARIMNGSLLKFVRLVSMNVVKNIDQDTGPWKPFSNVK